MPKSPFTPESRKNVNKVLAGHVKKAGRHDGSRDALIKRTMEMLEPKVDNLRVKATNYVDNHLRLKRETKVKADARREVVVWDVVRRLPLRAGVVDDVVKKVRKAWDVDALNDIDGDIRNAHNKTIARLLLDLLVEEMEVEVCSDSDVVQKTPSLAVADGADHHAERHCTFNKF